LVILVAATTPYYITFVVTNESGTDFAYTSLSSTDGMLADGSRSQGVSVIGTFDKCDNTSAPKEFTTKGATYTTCELALAGAGATVVGAMYSGTVGSDTPGSDYGEDPITWK